METADISDWSQGLQNIFRIDSIFRGEHLSVKIKLTLYKALIKSVMTYIYLLKLQRLQNKVLGTTENFPRYTLVRDFHTDFNLTYTGCPMRNLTDFGRVFLMLKYTDITQNTYVQSSKVTEIMAREKCCLLSVLRTVRLSWLSLSVCPWVGSPIAVSCISALFVAAAERSAMLSQCVTYSAWNSTDSYDTACEFFFVVQFNGFMSLTS
jgi:hypothetical protein